MTKFLIALWLALMSGPAAASPALDVCDSADHDAAALVSNLEEAAVAPDVACDACDAELGQLELDAVSGASGRAAPAGRDGGVVILASSAAGGRPRQVPGRTIYDDVPGEPLLTEATLPPYRRLEAMERSVVRIAQVMSAEPGPRRELRRALE